MMKSSSPGIWFVGRFLITLSNSELVIDLYIYIYILFFSWFSLETLYLFVHFFEVVHFVGIQLLIVWAFVFLWCPLLIFPFSSLILFIWVLPCFTWWTWLKFYQFCLSLKEPAFGFIAFCYCFLHLCSFTSALIFMIFFLFYFSLFFL